uniref:BZIP domain-containing protein n=1 Tax=Strongyloides stercoralis TaxID=6248 RepID=A0A0K0ETC6_STRER
MFSITKKLTLSTFFLLIVSLYFSEILAFNDKNLIGHSFNLKEVPVILNNEIDNHILKKRQRRNRRRRNRRHLENRINNINALIVQLTIQVQALQQQLSSRAELLTTTTTMPGG